MEEERRMGRRAGDVDYSQRELQHFFDEINQKLDNIHTQTVKTNGRVSSLEKGADQMEGAMKVVKIVLVPLFLAVLYTFIR